LTVGASCTLGTSAEAVLPGSVREGKRAVWEFAQVKVMDGGADDVAATQDNSLFATQGLFVP
jgi:hypothetical protein